MFAVLFDPSEMALGLTFFPDTSLILLSIAEIIGNVLWLLGVLWLILSAILIGALFVPKYLEDMIKQAVEDVQSQGETPTIDNLRNPTGDKGLMFPHVSLSVKMYLIFLAGCSLIAMGSGFWFTGVTWFSIIVLAQVYKRVGVPLAQNIIDEATN